MVRKHGWELPAHTFQVIAITVFCLLVVAFYAFFAPFVGGRIWEYVLVAAYSTVALLVFILYVRSTAINPADPGIMSKFDSNIANNQNLKLEQSTKSRKLDDFGNGANSSPSSASRSSIAGANSSRRGSAGEDMRANMQFEPHNHSQWLSFGGIFCGLFVFEDCCNRDGAAEEQGTGEDALYCTLCEAEVRKFSKHCRSCDKCVDGFDHHCRWLNNCVGRKNYITFISLMATSLLWLVIEVGVGLAVFVRCFIDKKGMEALIVDRLGNGFSRAPFAAVVAVCTAVSMLACVPLGELFFFHMILIRKGITTYEYVVAMRAMSEAPGGGSVDEEMPNVLHSPTGSNTTGFSGGSSLGLQYKGGAWCTPPRVFVDYQEEVVPHLERGMVPSTIDPDAAGNKLPKRPVKISAWKLAKLDSTEAMRAAAKARASSSVLRPVDNHRGADPELSSSGNMSIRSSVSTDTGIIRDNNKNDFKNSAAWSQASRDEYETGTQTASSFSSPSHVHESVTLSPLPQPRGLAQGFDERIMQRGVAHSAPPQPQPQVPVQVQAPAPAPAPAPATSLLRDVTRASVVWDQEAGRYVSVPVSAAEARNKSVVQMGGSSYGRRSGESSSSVVKAPLEQSEKLTYTGDSIFYGGPLLSVPVRNDSSAFRQGQERSGLSLPRETRFKRDSGSNQLPVFVPGGSEQNSILKRDL